MPVSSAGGLGSLGGLVAQWVAANPLVHVWLAGRSGRARGASWALPAVAAGQVHVLQCDTASASDAAALATAVAAAGAGPIRGVIHASGILKDATLAAQNAKMLRTVFAPKLQVPPDRTIFIASRLPALCFPHAVFVACRRAALPIHSVSTRS